MPNELARAVSPYLRLHAENPVEWREWGSAAFDEARERDVPVLVSIGYATCHWCHVMARESFSDPSIAVVLSRDFVSIKVDREERPDVDASCMAAASAFTEHLGWPLTVFATPSGQVFYAGTYYPPTPVGEHASFSQVLAAVTEAWRERRTEVEQNAAEIAAAVRAPSVGQELPSPEQVLALVPSLAAAEDPEFAGFGGAPKFPNAPLLELLADLGADARAGGGSAVAGDLAARTLRAIATSALCDPIDGGVFRYATRRDWTVPHYERMLYDNAGLLAATGVLLRTRAQPPAVADQGGADQGVADGGRTGSAEVVQLRKFARGIAAYLRGTLRVPDGPLAGAFFAGQDSESTIDGRRVEGAWFALDAAGRAELPAPPLDDQVLTGWNGLTIRALAIAGSALQDADMLDDARAAAAAILAGHTASGAVSVRSSTPRGPSSAPCTIEDVGLLADGLVELALATGEVRWATAALRIVEPLLDGGRLGGPVRFRPAAPADAVLASAGTVPASESAQTALRSGTTGLASAAWRLGDMTGRPDLSNAARSLVSDRAHEGLRSPLGYADALGLAIAMGQPPVEVVVVEPDDRAPDEPAPDDRTPDEPAPNDRTPDPESDRALAAGGHAPGTGAVRAALRTAALASARPGVLVSVSTSAQARAFQAAGFALWDGRADVTEPSAFVCHDHVCALPVTTASALRTALGWPANGSPAHEATAAPDHQSASDPS